MKKTTLAIAVVIVSLVLIGGAYAYQGGNRNNSNSVDRDASLRAIEQGDYSAWKELHMNSNGRMVSLINEDNFYLLKQMHDAREAGDFAKVNEVRSQLGFNPGNGQGNKNGFAKGMRKGTGNCPMLY